MESFGLFNFLKSAFTPAPSHTEENASGDAARKASSAFDPANIFGSMFSVPNGRGETDDAEPKPAPSKGEASSETSFSAPSPESATPESNPFLALMERHDKMAKSIDRKAPKR